MQKYLKNCNLFIATDYETVNYWHWYFEEVIINNYLFKQMSVQAVVILWQSMSTLLGLKASIR